MVPSTAVWYHAGQHTLLMGIETHCQWSDLAIARTTPLRLTVGQALLRSVSLVTLLAHRSAKRNKLATRQAVANVLGYAGYRAPLIVAEHEFSHVATPDRHSKNAKLLTIALY